MYGWFAALFVACIPLIYGFLEYLEDKKMDEESRSFYYLPSSED